MATQMTSKFKPQIAMDTIIEWWCEPKNLQKTSLSFLYRGMLIIDSDTAASVCLSNEPILLAMCWLQSWKWKNRTWSRCSRNIWVAKVLSELEYSLDGPHSIHPAVLELIWYDLRMQSFCWSSGVKVCACWSTIRYVYDRIPATTSTRGTASVLTYPKNCMNFRPYVVPDV